MDVKGGGHFRLLLFYTFSSRDLKLLAHLVALKRTHVAFHPRHTLIFPHKEGSRPAAVHDSL
jgi:hypothetical protein